MDEQAVKPNVLWIFGDQHAAHALGCMGNPNLHTPNLDRMASEGVNFTGALSGFPLCCPARGALLTGRYPHQTVPGHEYRLPPEQPTVATVLREAGYHTAYFGKWHLDGYSESQGRAAFHIIPPERRGGFHQWTVYENNNSQWDCWVHGGEGESSFHYRLPGYETDALTGLFIDHIRERARINASPAAALPFFAVLSVQPPHDPYHAPAEWMGRHTPAEIRLRPNVPPIPAVQDRARRELAGYYAMIENLDWNVGRILRALEETGLRDNTHVLFFSDHGDLHGSHGQFRKTAPWEEAIRVPLIIGGGPSQYAYRSGRYPLPVNHVDVAPTTLGLCGIPVPGWMAGTDYAAYRFHGVPEPQVPDSAYLQVVVPTGHHHSVDRPWRGIVTTDGWKYVALEGQPFMLFNLNEDPYELANHAYNTAYRARRKALQDRLAAWISDTGDSFTLPKI